MPSFTITNVSGSITVNGISLAEGSCRGMKTPAIVDGSGSFFVSCSPDRGERSIVEKPQIDDEGNVILDENDKPLTIETIVYARMPPVEITLTNEAGTIATVRENERYPSGDSYSLNGRLLIS